MEYKCLSDFLFNLCPRKVLVNKNIPIGRIIIDKEIFSGVGKADQSML